MDDADTVVLELAQESIVALGAADTVITPQRNHTAALRIMALRSDQSPKDQCLRLVLATDLIVPIYEVGSCNVPLHASAAEPFETL